MKTQLISALLFDAAQAAKDKTLAGFDAFFKESDEAQLQALGTVSRELVRHAAVHDVSAATAALKQGLLQLVTLQVRDAVYSGDYGTLPYMTGKVLKELSETYGETQIAYVCADLARSLGGSRVALVQSPVALSREQKKHMIEDLTKNQTPFFPLFVVRRELVGGVRVLLGDTLFDDTFHTQLRRIFAAVS